MLGSLEAAGEGDSGRPGDGDNIRPGDTDIDLPRGVCDWKDASERFTIAFFQFPKFKGIRFEDVIDIRKAVTTVLRRIPEESFQECMQGRQRRMGKYIKLRAFTLWRKMWYRFKFSFVFFFSFSGTYRI